MISSASITRTARRVFRRVATARAYRRVFAGDDGELVLHDLVRRGGVLRTPFDLRPGLTEWNAGRASLVLEIFKELNLNERDFERMARDITDADRNEE